MTHSNDPSMLQKHHNNTPLHNSVLFDRTDIARLLVNPPYMASVNVLNKVPVSRPLISAYTNIFLHAINSLYRLHWSYVALWEDTRLLNCCCRLGRIQTLLAFVFGSLFDLLSRLTFKPVIATGIWEYASTYSGDE